MTKEQIQTLLAAAEALAPLAGPYGAIGTLVLDAAVNEAAVLFHKGEMSQQEIEDVQARASLADSTWDEAVAKARATNPA
jgi:hypothetical protein